MTSASVRRRWQRKGYVTINIVKGPSVSQNGCTREVREEMMGWDGASGGDPDRARTLVGGKAVGWQLWSSGILDLDHSLFTTSAPHSLSRLPRLSPLPHGRHHPHLLNNQYGNPLLQNSFFHKACAQFSWKNDVFWCHKRHFNGFGSVLFGISSVFLKEINEQFRNI